MVADIQPIPKRITYPIELRERIHADALLIGIRPAARKYGVNEDTVCTWAKREQWKLPQCLVTLRRSGKRAQTALDADESRLRAMNALAASIDEHGEHSRLYLSAATLQAAHTLAEKAGKTEGERVPYAGLLNVSRSGDTVHGWQAQRTAGPTVQIANVIMPTPEEKAQREAIDAKLDAITRRLTEQHQARINAH